jgi:hypothetical protein
MQGQAAVTGNAGRRPTAVRWQLADLRSVPTAYATDTVRTARAIRAPQALRAPARTLLERRRPAPLLAAALEQAPAAPTPSFTRAPRRTCNKPTNEGRTVPFKRSNN